MDKIKFGNDGWWGIIAKDVTLANVTKVAYAIARWMTNKFQVSSVLLGYDTRFGGELFMEAVAKIIASKGIQVFIPEGFVTSPMVSLGIVKLKAQCGVIITASHNPAAFNGIKLKGEHGGPLFKKDIKDIENLISNDYEFDLEMLNWNYLLEQGNIQYINLESIYIKHIYDTFDIPAINESNLRIAFDSMYGSSQNVMKKLFPKALHFHDDVNPSFNGVPPDPIPRNLHEMADHIHQYKDIDSALAVDADGDRMALFDENGNYIDSHRVFLLVIHYLIKYCGFNGKVLASFSLTAKVEKICAHYGIEVVRTQLGFNNIAEIMLNEKILVGGEETGGVCIGGYLPERDGLWMGIQIWSWLIESGKKLVDLISEVEEITGTFANDKTELHLNKNERTKIMEKCKNGEFTEFDSNLVTRVENVDGYKFFFGNKEWALIRPSSIHPILRLYVEAESIERAHELMQSIQYNLTKEL
jgi:phosphomannomutase